MNQSAADITTGWTSTATLEEIAAALRDADDIILTTHSKPDGDAIGSTLAIARALQLVGKKATPLYMPPWFESMDPLIGETPILHLEHDCFEKEPLAGADCVLITDTGSWTQLADARTWLTRHHDQAIIIDHHAHGDPEVAPMRYIDTTVAAACEPAAELCWLLLDVKSPRQLPVEVAEPLYLGLATDTGWFRYPNTTAKTMRLAGDLIEAGVKHNDLYQLIEQRDRPVRLRLMAQALNSLSLHDDDRIAVMSLTQNDIENAGGTLEDADGFTDLPQSVKDVRIVAMLTELEGGITKVSFRSKNGPGGLNVNHVAQQFGGGGHANAAGAKIRKPVAEARQDVIKALLEAT